MRGWVWLLVVVLGLAGCATETQDRPRPPASALPPESPASSSTTASAAVTQAPGSPSSSPPTSAPTSAPPQAPPASPANASKEPRYGVLSHDHFEGSLLAAAPDQQNFEYPFVVSATADEVVLHYNRTYTGVFSGWSDLIDPDGNVAANVYDSCGLPPVGVVYHLACSMSAKAMPGTWKATVSWQLGEVAEDYTLDALSMGALA